MNCHGLKTNIGYVRDLSMRHIVNFICEHWLHPHELNTVQSIFEEDSKWCYLKSSIDPILKPKGRPFGGLGFICGKFEDIAYRIIDSESDRLCSLQIIQCENVIATIIGVYLPFHDGSPEQIELYMDTLANVQSLIDVHGECAPVIVVGDFNTSLPQKDVLLNNWHKCRPFSRNSALLYNFIEDNDLCVVNFIYSQDVNFTYSNANGSLYIDHILVPDYVMDMVTDCKILNRDIDNISDHNNEYFSICQTA